MGQQQNNQQNTQPGQRNSEQRDVREMTQEERERQQNRPGQQNQEDYGNKQNR
ncbi:MAG: hypothetical protein AB7H77_02695 [Bdellovibrionales bacterium]